MKVKAQYKYKQISTRRFQIHWGWKLDKLSNYLGDEAVA